MQLSKYALNVSVLMAIGTGALAVAAPAQEAPAARLHALEDYEHARTRDQTPEDQRDHLIVAEYDRLFPFSDGKLQRMPDDELRAAFEASYIAAFFALDRRVTAEVQRYLDALQRKGLASTQDFVKMHDIFIATRRFDDANQIKAKHPGLKVETAPAIIGRPGVHKPGKLALSAQGDALVYQPVDVSGKVLVVIAHPLCHFSVNAIKAITEQPALGALFKASVWLAPPGPRLNIREIAEWNEDHPGATLALMDQKEDWPMFDAWATPTFYFLNHGKVVAKVEGWPPANGMDDLDRAAARWKAAR